MVCIVRERNRRSRRKRGVRARLKADAEASTRLFRVYPLLA
jgi:hypothetical protein